MTPGTKLAWNAKHPADNWPLARPHRPALAMVMRVMTVTAGPGCSRPGGRSLNPHRSTCRNL